MVEQRGDERERRLTAVEIGVVRGEAVVEYGVTGSSPTSARISPRSASEASSANPVVDPVVQRPSVPRQQQVDVERERPAQRGEVRRVRVVEVPPLEVLERGVEHEVGAEISQRRSGFQRASIEELCPAADSTCHGPIADAGASPGCRRMSSAGGDASPSPAMCASARVPHSAGDTPSSRPIRGRSAIGIQWSRIFSSCESGASRRAKRQPVRSTTVAARAA